MTTRILWFRRDLRLGDHPALLAAADGARVLPLFVLDPRLAAPGPRLDRLLASLAALRDATSEALVIRSGDPASVVPTVAREVGAHAVHVSAESTPYGRRRDALVRERLRGEGVEFVETGSPYAVTPGRVRNRTGDPYRVFTPFLHAWRDHGWRAPAGLADVAWVRDVDSLALPQHPQVDAGERAALERWQSFLAEDLDGYATDRDRPDLDSTSRLSVALKYGEIHPRTLLADLLDVAADAAPADIERYVTELAWREFHADVLHHAPNSVWFLNLGHAPHVAVTGEVTGGEDFLRHLAAELALNPWSAEVDIDTFGLSPSLVGIDPHRLHHHADTRLLDKLTADLAQPGIPGLAPERRRALLLEHTYAATDAAHAITSANTTHAARGITVVTVGDHRTDESLALDVDESARLTLPILGITIAAAGLSDAEASACAAILDVTRDATLAPVPVDETATGRDKLVDKAGALRDELVESRPVGPAGGMALLPRPTSEYADVAATTSEDVETLAPVVPETTRAAVEDADPTLDQEVAWWFDPTCRLPRISVLGPVHGRAYGDATDIAGRKPFYTEMLAFLALHPDGVTSGQVADAFAITPKRARVDMNALRSWLGTNPHTSGPHLPKADESRAARQRGGHFYQVDDVLLDADLFRRLRARGQARGVAGINDLATALRLVTGQPFGQLRNNGWSWVLEGDRLDHILTCAIVDVAHIVTTHALAEGDLAMAHEAAEVAHHAAPYDEITNLDLVAVASAEGHEELAEKLLNDRIYNRSDDDLGPVELPPRTQDMASKRPQNGSQPSGNRPVPAPRKG